MTLQFDEHGEPIKPDLSSQRKLPNPTVWSEELQERLCAALYNLYPVKLACALVGIHVDTFYTWMRDGRKGIEPYTGFAMEAERALAQGQGQLVRKITKSAESGNTTDAKWLLERRFPDDWGKKDKVEHTGDPSQPITVELRWPGQDTDDAEAMGVPQLPPAPEVADGDIVDAEVVEDERTA